MNGPRVGASRGNTPPPHERVPGLALVGEGVDPQPDGRRVTPRDADPLLREDRDVCGGLRRRPLTVLSKRERNPPALNASRCPHAGRTHQARAPGARARLGRDRLARGRVAVALGAGIAAGSIALIAFGADSVIEAFAGFVVVWLFMGARVGSHRAERRAQQLIAASFFVLAAYVAVESVRDLAWGDHPATSWVGIALAAVTAPTMPLLALAKRRIGEKLGSSATVKEGAQNMVCAYLSVALLVGLLLNAAAGWWWADPVAALVIAAVAVREGRASWRGEGCCDTC